VQELVELFAQCRQAGLDKDLAQTVPMHFVEKYKRHPEYNDMEIPCKKAGLSGYQAEKAESA